MAHSSETTLRHNLPARDYERFVGRHDELAQLRRLLLPYPKSRYHLVTIDGIGGIGKSALALETAWRLAEGEAAAPEAERFAAIVWVSAKRTYLTVEGIEARQQRFGGLGDLYAAVAQVLAFPAITRARAEEQRSIVEQVLGEQRTLLILDNLETVDDEELLAFLRDLPDPTKALMTTRHRADVAYPVRLGGLPRADAHALIVQEAARKGVGMDEGEREQLWMRTGGVPLAAVWSLGLMAAGVPVDEVLRRLGQGQSDIARFCFAESAARIRERDAYSLLLALGRFTSDASREALGVVAGLADDPFGRDLGLDELERLSLVNKAGDRFSLLPLTQAFVRGAAEAEQGERQALSERWVAYYAEFVNSYSGWSDDWRGHDLVEVELENIFAVFAYLVATLEYEGTSDREQIVAERSIPNARLLLRIADRISRTMRIRGHWSDCERLAQAALPISKATGQQPMTGWLNYTLARIHYYRGDIEAARLWALDVLAVAQQHGELAMSSRAKLLLGMAELHQQQLEPARALFAAALEEARSTGSKSGASDILAALGDLALQTGDPVAAAAQYQQAITIARQVNDIPKLASHLMRLGNTSRLVGDLPGAARELEECLRLARECGSVSVIAGALYNLALLAGDQGSIEPAHAQARQALELFRRLGMRQEQAQAETLLAV